jgi:hypothetical protein
VGLERCSLSLVSTTEELLGRKGCGSGLESRDYGRIVRSRTQATEFFLISDHDRYDQQPLLSKFTAHTSVPFYPPRPYPPTHLEVPSTRDRVYDTAWQFGSVLQWSTIAFQLRSFRCFPELLIRPQKSHWNTAQNCLSDHKVTLEYSPELLIRPQKSHWNTAQNCLSDHRSHTGIQPRIAYQTT